MQVDGKWAIAYKPNNSKRSILTTLCQLMVEGRKTGKYYIPENFLMSYIYFNSICSACFTEMFLWAKFYFQKVLQILM